MPTIRFDSYADLEAYVKRAVDAAQDQQEVRVVTRGRVPGLVVSDAVAQALGAGGPVPETPAEPITDTSDADAGPVSEPVEAPARNASTKAWAAFLESQGVEHDGLDRDGMIDAWDRHTAAGIAE